jgi:hypothetical protein
LLTLGAAALLYIVVGFALMDADTLYSGDIGVQYVQSRTLADHGFVRMWLDYPGEFIDGRRQFFPFLPPFTFRSHGHREVIFPPARAWLTAPFAVLGGLRGMVVLSVVSAIAALWLTWVLSPGAWYWPLPAILGLATCFWFYAVVPLAHTPSVAMDMAALWLACFSRSPRRALIAGALFGFAGLVRDESLLLLPGLLFAFWYRDRALRPLVIAAASMTAVLAISGAVEVLVYERPLAAHPRHAVSSLRAALQLTGSENQGVPTLPALSSFERYDIVVHQWIVGRGNDWYIAGFVALMFAAAVIRRWTGSALGVLAAGAIVLAMTVPDALALLAAPKFVGGLLRLSPFLVFTALPAAARDGGDRSNRMIRAVSAVALAAFVGIALLVTDSVAGKSLGPRILLPVLPLATILAWQNIVSYVRSDRGYVDRATGIVGLALVVASAAIHLGSTMPALIARNREERQAVQWVRESAEQVVVADEEITAQLVTPLYFSKVILLAENPQQRDRLVQTLTAARVPSLLLVSRSQPPLIGLEPYGRSSSRTAGRFVVERWER